MDAWEERKMEDLEEEVETLRVALDAIWDLIVIGGRTDSYDGTANPVIMNIIMEARGR